MDEVSRVFARQNFEFLFPPIETNVNVHFDKIRICCTDLIFKMLLMWQLTILN